MVLAPTASGLPGPASGGPSLSRYDIGQRAFGYGNQKAWKFMGNLMVGRQPIFDAKRDVQGYGLSFKDLGPSTPGGDALAADAGDRGCPGFGLRDLVGAKFAFVNATREFLAGSQEAPFLVAGRTVVEIPQDLARADEVLVGCRRLFQEGFALALGGYAWDGDDEDPVLELASAIKLDAAAIGPARLPGAVQACSAFGLQLVAEKIDTPERFRQCASLGFDLFQGHLFSHADLGGREALSPSRLTCLEVLRELCDPKTSARTVERVVRKDAALSYRFLRLASTGAERSLYRPVTSVRDAVVLLGERRLRSWVTLMMVADAQEGQTEQLMIAMTRARMSELVALEVEPRLADSAFTVGLVSALDLLLQAPLPTVLEPMALAPALVDALLGRVGVLGRILADVLAWEVGEPGPCLLSGLPVAGAARCYVKALSWAVDVCAVLEAPA